MKPEYPVDFPLDSITNLVTTLKAGEAASNIPVLAYDLWVVQGYAQRQLIGVPGDPTAPTVAVAAQDVPDVLGVLEALVQNGYNAQSVINWAAVLTWALQELIKLAAQHGKP